MAGRTIHDPAKCRELSEPFADSEAAEAALEAFFAELGELRSRHRLARVLCCAAVNIHDPSGEYEATTYAHFGDSLRALPLAAYVYGAETEATAARVAGMVAQGKKRGKG